MKNGTAVSVLGREMGSMEPIGSAKPGGACADLVSQELPVTTDGSIKLGHCSNRTASWSTGGSTATSTKSLPTARLRRDNCVISVEECASAPTITSSTSRRIPTGTAGSGAVEFPSKLRSYRWGRRRRGWVDLVSNRKPRGYQFDMRFSAGKRDVFPALRSTGSLPVFWNWNIPRGRTVWCESAYARFHLNDAMPTWMPSAATGLCDNLWVSRKLY